VPPVQVPVPALVRPAQALEQEPETRLVSARPELVRVQALVLVLERRQVPALVLRASVQTTSDARLA
jgi:hypothetical protein